MAAAAGGALGCQGLMLLAAAAAKGLGSLKDIALKGMQNYNANTAGAGGIGGLSGKRIEDMTREELLEYIKSGGNSKQGLTGNQKSWQSHRGGLGFDTSAYDAMAQGGLISLAEGGDVDFPSHERPDLWPRDRNI